MFKPTLAFVFTAVVLALCVSAPAQDHPMLINRVAINQTHVAFTYAGKIWLVDRAGGPAKRLTNTPNEETNPVFSPDGRRIAFSRSNGNDWDVFVMAANGSGEARRVTMMPEDDLVTSWTPDGSELVFETTRDEEGVGRLYKTTVDNEKLATALPLPSAYQGSISPDGSRVAYNPRLGFGEWRYYRGGSAAPIWIADLKTGALEKLPNQKFNDRSPVWLGDKIYFTSDRTGVFNLFAYETKSKKTKQLTTFDGQGIRTAAVTEGAVCFIQNGRIHILDLASSQDKIINVSVSPDTSELRPKNANAMRFLEQIMPSRSADKIAFGARGEVLIFETANGSYKNLTNTSGAAERYPVISPDGTSIAYFSDESGEYQLHIRALGDGGVRKIEIEKEPSFYTGLVWSPDSKKLVFSDRRLGFWLADVSTNAAAKIETADYSAQIDWSPSFSPDSRYVAYQRRGKNRTGTIFIRDIAQRKNFQVTDGITHCQLPAFDANGKYLYFASSMNAGMGDYDWGVLNGIFVDPLIVSRIHAVALAKDTPSLFLPNGRPNPDAKTGESLPQVKIDIDGISARVVNLQVPQRDFTQITAGAPGRLVVAISEWSAAPGDFGGRPRSQAVYTHDPAKGDGLQKVMDGIDAVDITHDGSKILYRKGRDFYLVGTSKPAAADEGKQNFSAMEVRVDPAQEWKQIFHESMRIMRDWFYDPNHHGRDLNSLEREYTRYLPLITRRTDLNRLMSQMLGNVSVSHLGVGGGDAVAPAGGGNRIGLLGADYEIANGHYRIRKIYGSTTYAAANGPFSAPLDQPGVDIREGDYILEVDGKKIDPAKNILGYFVDTVGKPVKITVSADPSEGNVRTSTVYPSAGENRLRRANWAEKNRKLVEKLSGGRLGYIFIEDYGLENIMKAVRGLSGYADKAGVIVDQRYNGGGITPDYLIEWMMRKPLYYYMFRGGDDIATPVNTAPPVKVMIINEINGSAAETGAYMFKLGKAGDIVGKSTYGGGIGPYFFTPNLIDGGRVQLPNRAAYKHDGTTWGIENIGVAPDFDVEITPQDLLAGRDPQLEKAVEIALARIAKNPVIVPKRPAFPVHPGKQDAASSTFDIPLPGSAFPAPVEQVTVQKNTVGKFAEFLGRFETPIGVISFSQEGEKLVGDAGGERIELVPDGSVKDKFVSQGPPVSVNFERDENGKITGITVLLPGGRVVKGKKL